MTDSDELKRRWVITLGSDVDFETLDPLMTYRLRGGPDPAPADTTVVLESARAKGGGEGGGEGGELGSTEGTEKPDELESLDDFSIEEEIGRGGMGVVYRARQLDLCREVALKRIRRDRLQAGASAARLRSGFLSEAYVSGFLEHPNIVPVHLLGRTRIDEPFIAMKLVEGRSWQSLLEEDSGENLQAHLDILLQVSNAVAFAHSRRIVHNDLKPANVMVGSYGEVLVMDWGLASRYGPDQGDTPLPHCGRIANPIGTPSYMPPELALGQGDRIGPWTDIYLLGATLHHVLSGRPPHPGQTFLDVLKSAARGTIEALPETTPRELGDLCRRAMAVAPEDRCRDVAEFQNALRAYILHWDSLKISDRAESRLGSCLLGLKRGVALSEAEYNRLYREFASVVAGFEQAAALWEQNPAAGRGARQARLAYAVAALERNDLGLAETLLSELRQLEGVDGDDVGKLEESIGAVRLKRRLDRRMRRLLVGGLILLLLFVIPLFFWNLFAKVRLPLVTLPESASVVLDGVELREKTPLELALGPGEHEIRIRSQGYREAVRRVRVAFNAVGGLSKEPVVLLPNFAVFSFASNPPGAEVELWSAGSGEKVASFETPRVHRLEPGRYRAVFKKVGYRDVQADSVFEAHAGWLPGVIERELMPE